MVEIWTLPQAKLSLWMCTGSLVSTHDDCHIHAEKAELIESDRRATLSPAWISVNLHPPLAALSHNQVIFSISESTEAGERQNWTGALWRQELCCVLKWGTSQNKTKLLPTQTDKKNNRILKCLDIAHRLYPEVYQSLFWSNSYMSLKNYFSPPR